MNPVDEILASARDRRLPNAEAARMVRSSLRVVEISRTVLLAVLADLTDGCEGERPAFLQEKK